MKKFIIGIMLLSMCIIPSHAAYDNSVTEQPQIENIVEPTSETLTVNIAPASGYVLTEEEIQTAIKELDRRRIEEEQRKAAEEAARKATEAEVVRKQYVEAHRGSYNVWEKTGLSVDEFNSMLSGYYLAGQGQAFYDMEQKFNINGIFAMAVAKTESTLGGYAPVRSRHTYFGIIGKSYSSDYNGIVGFGSYLYQDLYRGKSIESIARIYCPPTAGHWASQNKQFMREFWSKI